MARRATAQAEPIELPTDLDEASRLGLRLTEADTPPPPRKVDPRNKLNELTSREWVAETKSFSFQKGLGASHPHAEIERMHPAPFSYQDVARLIRFFTKTGERVLDPFLGVGSTLKACAILGREGVGVELMSTWADLAKLRLEREVDDIDQTSTQLVINDDVRTTLPNLDDDAFHLVVTSPPYWRILNKVPDHKALSERVHQDLAVSYGNDVRDLGNVETYDDFLSELISIFADCERVTAPGGHLAIIVGDFRHGKTFIPFHADLARDLPLRSEWILQAVNIILQNHKRLFPYGYPYAYVPNIHHQFLLIFKRPR
jgi:DNA modification methylase